MKLRSAILLIGLLVGFSGCRRVQSTKAQVKPLSTQDLLADDECQDLAAVGDYMDLRRQIHVDTTRILDYTGSENPIQFIDQVLRAAKRIEVSSQRLKAVLNARWIDEKWSIETQWSVYWPDQDPRSIEAQVEEVFLNGAKRPDLIEYVKIQKSRDGLNVYLKRNASSLEICELQESFGIHLVVLFKGVFRVTNHYILTTYNEGRL